jgi:hypothetical protein
MRRLAIHDGLVSSRRLALTANPARLGAWELAALGGIGFLTAVLNAYVKPSLGIPGSSIVFVTIPLALGMALVPRKGAGIAIGLSSLASMLLLHKAGAGAITSMVATAVFLDLALRNAKSGLRLYTGFVLAGLAGNTVAFFARGLAKAIGFEPGHLPLAAWAGHGAISYALCGALAGFMGAVMWFHFGKRAK